MEGVKIGDRRKAAEQPRGEENDKAASQPTSRIGRIRDSIESSKPGPWPRGGYTPDSQCIILPEYSNIS